MIQGEHIALRPVEREDLALLEAWEDDPAVLGEFNTFGLHGRQGKEEAFAKEGFLGANQGTLIVAAEGEAVGLASYRRVDHGPPNGGHPTSSERTWFRPAAATGTGWRPPRCW
jgi:RimJ/RimL family protein N-acetyltransferase